MEKVLKMLLSALPKKVFVNMFFDWLAEKAKETEIEWDDIAVEVFRKGILDFITQIEK